jgi:curved DNA-binding protein CbpA
MRKFKNYYRVLRVGRFASREEIRRSFRKLAKEYHPDTSVLHPEESALRIRILLEAYRILMDEEKRSAYNLRFPGRGRSGYRENLLRRRESPYARALLILYDLLNGDAGRAVINYENALSGKENGEELLERLGFADYLDCLFLLGEEYQNQSRFQEAVRHYEAAFRGDLKWNYFRRFRPELLERIRNIYCRKLARNADPADAIGYYRHLLDDYRFPRPQRAYFHKKMAESYCDLNDLKMARSHLAEAFRLKARLGGTKKIQQRLKHFGE